MNEAIELLRELVDVGLSTSLKNRARALLAAHPAPAPAGDGMRDVIMALFQPWPEGELGPSDEPESRYRLGYNTALEDAADALAARHAPTGADAPAPSVTAEAVATIHVDGSFVHVEWHGVAPNKASIKVFSASAPSVAAVTLNDWTFKDFQDGKLLAQQADGSGAVVTDNPSDGIAQCILARLIKDILAQRAAPVAAEAEIFEWLETGISAVDCWYRGDPSYERDAYWMRDRVIDLVREAKKIFGTQRAGTGGDATVTVNRTDLKWLLSMSAGVSRSDAYISLSAAMEAAKS